MVERLFLLIFYLNCLSKIFLTMYLIFSHEDVAQIHSRFLILFLLRVSVSFFPVVALEFSSRERKLMIFSSVVLLILLNCKHLLYFKVCAPFAVIFKNFAEMPKFHQPVLLENFRRHNFGYQLLVFGRGFFPIFLPQLRNDGVLKGQSPPQLFWSLGYLSCRFTPW